MIKYAGYSKLGKPILSALYLEGWDALVKEGYHPLTTRGEENHDLHHFVALCGDKQVGILSLRILQTGVDVLMLYVRPDYRRNSLAKALHLHAVEWCAGHNWRSLTYRVSVHNSPARGLMQNLNGSPKSITYRHELT